MLRLGERQKKNLECVQDSRFHLLNGGDFYCLMRPLPTLWMSMLSTERDADMREQERTTKRDCLTGDFR